MFIKQIIIQGFKSYKEQTEIAPFSPASNVIIGKNGSGKSNFFSAVRFVLGDDKTQLSREEKTALMHEGSGQNVWSAYVEVIFDNSDDRFPTGKPEAIIRRSLGLKKDEYSIDRKNSTKVEVMSLFESAGFSRSNPYYIVPQGRITQLTNMKDDMRLSKLKEVAGTQVYENRRQESLKILKETENKQDQIDALLATIRERLDELEQEKAELTEYQQLDRQRRILDYTFHSRNHERITDKLENFEERRHKKAEEQEERVRESDQVKEQLDEIQRTIQMDLQNINILNDEKRQCENDYSRVKSEQTRSRLERDSLKGEQSESDITQQERARRLQYLTSNIAAREKEFEKALPEYTKIKDQEMSVKTQLELEQSTQRRLRGKQQYSSKQGRDAALTKQINSIQGDLGNRKATAMANRERIASLEKLISSVEADIKQINVNLSQGQEEAQKYPDRVAKLDQELSSLEDERRVLLREENQIHNQIKTAEIDYQVAREKMGRLADRNAINGINAVRAMKARGEIEGIYGVLGELITVKSPYEVPVEVIGGQQTLSIVVDTDETGNKIIQKLQQSKAGRVTLIPLNQMRDKDTPLTRTADAYPVMSRLEYDPEIERAVQHVFGKAVICPDMQTASDYAMKHNATAVIMNGARADPQGSLTGGFVDTKRARIGVLHEELDKREALNALRESERTLRDRKETLAQLITQKRGEQTKVSLDQTRAERGDRSLRQDLHAKLQQLPQRQSELEAKKAKQQEDDGDYNRLDDELTNIQEEIASAFQPKLSKDETRQLELLNTSIPKLQKQYTELNARRNDLEVTKTNLEYELNGSLRPQLTELQADNTDAPDGAFGTHSKLVEAERRLAKATALVQSTKAQIEECNKQLNAANKKLQGDKQSYTGKEQEQNERKEEIDKYIRRLANIHSERAAQELLKKGSKQKLDELGSIPTLTPAEQKYRGWKDEKLDEETRKVKKKLKSYTHVNKKAVEQYNNFTAQRDKLNARYEELESSYSSIQSLIEHLDHRKDEALQRTFKQVSKEFAWVFKQLVPAGQGRLIIQRKTDQQLRRGEDQDGEGERGNGSGVESYTGVGISVSFNSEHDEQQKVQQLSGGQKSLCALALVFAIQRCDPAPFYIFDEIDANLDAQYRTAVAKMIKTLSEPNEDGTGGGQFICTTFSRELIVDADKCYLVTFSNKTSTVDVVYKDTALQFVEEQQKKIGQ